MMSSALTRQRPKGFPFFKAEPYALLRQLPG